MALCLGSARGTAQILSTNHIVKLALCVFVMLLSKYQWTLI